MEARFMKNTKYFALGLSLLFSVCIQSQSVFAQEKAIEIQNEEMIVDQLLTMKGFSLEDLKCVEKEKGSMVYENDAMKVTVENLDLDSLGMQDVSITYSVKSSKALWDKMNHSDSSQVSSDYTITKKVEIVDNEAPVIEAQDRYVITQGDDFDLEKEIDAVYPTEHITQALVEETLKKFIGEIYQVPPVFSACKVNGDRAYDLARKGEAVELQPKLLVIDELELLRCELPEIEVRVVCSKGTYIRALARDIGEALNSGAHLTALRRTRVGTVRVEDCLQLDSFQEWLDNQTIDNTEE